MVRRARHWSVAHPSAQPEQQSAVVAVGHRWMVVEVVVRWGIKQTNEQTHVFRSREKAGVLARLGAQVLRCSGPEEVAGSQAAGVLPSMKHPPRLLILAPYICQQAAWRHGCRRMQGNAGSPHSSAFPAAWQPGEVPGASGACRWATRAPRRGPPEAQKPPSTSPSQAGPLPTQPPPTQPPPAPAACGPARSR